MTVGESGQPSILVLEKCVRVLDCFTPERPKLQVADLRRLTGMPATTVTRIVRALTDNELLRRDGDVYRLGLRVLAWTAAATAGSELIEAAEPVVAHLRDLTGETSGIYIRRGTARVVVCVKLSRQSVIYQTQVGQVQPMYAGAAAKVFMAFDRQALTVVLEQNLDPAPAVIANRARLEGELARVREQGWAFTEQERESGLNSIAAPVFNAVGEIVATIGAGGPSFRLTREVARDMGPLVAEAAGGLSRRLGHSPPAGAPAPGIGGRPRDGRS